MNPEPWTGSWHAWRLDRDDHAATWDSGLGAFKVGGRWNTAGHRVVYASTDPSTAILEVAVHKGFDVLDTVPHVLTCFEVTDHNLIHVVRPSEAKFNKNWLVCGTPSPNQQKHGDGLLAKFPFVLIPSAVSNHSWNLIMSCDLAKGHYRLISQEPFALDTRLVKP